MIESAGCSYVNDVFELHGGSLPCAYEQNMNEKRRLPIH